MPTSLALPLSSSPAILILRRRRGPSPPATGAAPPSHLSTSLPAARGSSENHLNEFKTTETTCTTRRAQPFSRVRPPRRLVAPSRSPLHRAGLFTLVAAAASIRRRVVGLSRTRLRRTTTRRELRLSLRPTLRSTALRSSITVEVGAPRSEIVADWNQHTGRICRVWPPQPLVLDEARHSGSSHRHARPHVPAARGKMLPRRNFPTLAGDAVRLDYRSASRPRSISRLGGRAPGLHERVVPLHCTRARAAPF